MKQHPTLLSALTAAALLWSVPAQATAPCPTKWTDDGYVALRAGPGTNFKIVKKLWYQTAVDLYTTGHTSKWLKVSVNNAQGVTKWRGYVRKTLIDLDSCG